MTRKGLRKHEFYLSPDVMDIILEVSSRRDVQLDKGLSQIVLEWAKSIKIEPLDSTPKSPELSYLSASYRSIDKKLDSILDASLSVIAVQTNMLSDNQIAIDKRIDAIREFLLKTEIRFIKTE